MLRRNAAVAILVLVFIGVAWSVAEGQNTEPNKQQDESTDVTRPSEPPALEAVQENDPHAAGKGDERDQQPERAFNWRDAFLPEMWPQWVGVMIGAVGIFAALRTLRVMSDQTTASQDALLLAYRPAVVVRSVVIRGWTSGDVHPHITDSYVRLVNVGQTPAVVLHLSAKWLITSHLPMENPMHTIAGDVHPVTLAPGAMLTMPAPTYDLNLSEFIGIDTDAGERSLFLIGYIKYTHAVTTPSSEAISIRRTFFARRYRPKLGRFEVENNADYEYSE